MHSFLTKLTPTPIPRHLHHHLHHLRTLTSATSATTSAQTHPLPHHPHPSPPLTPPSPQITKALSDLSTLPELSQALTTPDPSLSHTLLTRLLQIFPSATHAALLHSLLAKLHHRQGSLSAERGHRLHVSTHLASSLPTIPHPTHRQLQTAHAAASHLALALACLRGPPPEARLAAAAPAASAQALATAPPLRTAASLLNALAAQPQGTAMRALLSALVAVDDQQHTQLVDIPGFARLFLAIHGGHTVDRLDHAKALVVRWQSRPGFDLVETLCVAASVVAEHGDLDMAEDLLAKGVRVAGDVGNELDKSEPLLGLASLYEITGRVVEAEGLYRSIEERFQKVWEKRMFTVSSADVYARTMDKFADFLTRVEFNGKTREKEGAVKKERANHVRAIYPELLGEQPPCVPFWVVDSLLPHFELPEPSVRPPK